MDVFELTKKTLLAVISESSSSDDYLEALAEIEGLVKHEAAATSFQLMERGKEKTVFDWKSEFNLKNAKKVERWTVEEKEKREKQRCFIEVEHYKKKEYLNFLYPGVHYCTCPYFQSTVLQKQTNWICVHILAYYFAKNFGKIERIECKSEIVGLVKKIFIRSIFLEEKK
ncbi:SWIM-type domain-containing protein [Caenorhabditis elegans]|uniref:SWIM-type domain-containing protein n=2 Tax=Caenorhabditis elegans TaxID=6239 RepID=A0A0K3AY91_CAEEL|nr:SWIM-type domain-containing protein [Caenorhabditis elegans]CTQ86933.1 SWIM-type domain-containing protein [Caenorhabditis elegans]|eukprot:NP_001300234.1 SWS1 homolog [Caenorhabditis elegans]